MTEPWPDIICRRVRNPRNCRVTAVYQRTDGRWAVVATPAKNVVVRYVTDLPPRVGDWVADPESRP